MGSSQRNLELQEIPTRMKEVRSAEWMKRSFYLMFVGDVIDREAMRPDVPNWGSPVPLTHESWQTDHRGLLIRV
jgi:hypothetical protein